MWIDFFFFYFFLIFFFLIFVNCSRLDWIDIGTRVLRDGIRNETVYHARHAP